MCCAPCRVTRERSTPYSTRWRRGRAPTGVLQPPTSDFVGRCRLPPGEPGRPTPRRADGPCRSGFPTGQVGAARGCGCLLRLEARPRPRAREWAPCLLGWTIGPSPQPRCRDHERPAGPRRHRRTPASSLDAAPNRRHRRPRPRAAHRLRRRSWRHASPWSPETRRPTRRGVPQLWPSAQSSRCPTTPGRRWRPPIGRDGRSDDSPAQ